MQLTKTVNLFGLAGGILMVAVVCLSIFTPWWKLQIGGGTTFATINANPFCTNFGFLGLDFIIPLLFAINIGTMALFVASGAFLIVYSVNPSKSYSEQLLCHGYKRPIYTVVGFIVTLIIIAYLLPFVLSMVSGLNMSVPLFQLMGTSILHLPSNIFANSLQIGVTVTAAFQYTFYLAVIATALAITARVYHRKMLARLTSPAAAAPSD